MKKETNNVVQLKAAPTLEALQTMEKLGNMIIEVSKSIGSERSLARIERVTARLESARRRYNNLHGTSL